MLFGMLSEVDSRKEPHYQTY